MLNSFVGIGRLTRDPELKYTPGGKAVCQMRIAIDRGTKNERGEKETDFINVVVWDKQGEHCANFLQKGRLIAAKGRLQVRQYQKDGQNREIAEVVADRISFLDRPAEETVNQDDMPPI